MSRPFYIKQTKSGRVFDALNLVLMLAILVVVVYPFINVLAISFNDGYDAVRGGIYLWPRVFSLENYKFVLADSSLVRGFFVSVVRTLVGTATAVLGNALLGYIVSCRQFGGRKFMRILFLITMYFGGGLIPVYLLMTAGPCEYAVGVLAALHLQRILYAAVRVLYPESAGGAF